jgi:hypothetical protein
VLVVVYLVVEGGLEMKAKVTSVEYGKVRVIVRRNHREEGLRGIHADLSVGDVVEVVRQVNNPYLIRVTNG